MGAYDRRLAIALLFETMQCIVIAQEPLSKLRLRDVRIQSEVFI